MIWSSSRTTAAIDTPGSLWQDDLTGVPAGGERSRSAATFVVLARWTDRGEENDRETLNRFRKVRSDFEAMGVNFAGVWWTQGRFDVIFVLEAPDEITVTAALLKLDSAANIHTETLRGFTEQEMEQIIGKMG